MISQKELSEIKERAEKATAGPWELEYDSYRDSFTVPKLKSVCEGCVGSTEFTDNDNAKFIAASRTDIPKLVEALEESQYDRLNLVGTINDFLIVYGSSNLANLHATQCLRETIKKFKGRENDKTPKA